MAEHSDLTDPELHEPKGASTASANNVYVADGAGSGTWQKVDSDVLDYSGVLSDIQDDIDDGTLELNGRFFLYATLEDVSTPSSILIPIRVDSTFVGATMILGGSITTADASVSFKDSVGGSMGTATTITQSGSAKGTAFSFTASTNNVFTAPDWMEIATDGGSDTAMPLYFILEFDGLLNG